MSDLYENRDRSMRRLMPDVYMYVYERGREIYTQDICINLYVDIYT